MGCAIFNGAVETGNIFNQFTSNYDGNNKYRKGGAE
jgi:hypothetical protein